MTTPAMQDQLTKITQFADHAVRAMIVKVTAVDLTNGDCTVDAQDDGGAIADVPFYGSDPVVGDLCLAWIFDGTIAVMGNKPLKTKITTNADPVSAASGWSIANAYMDIGDESAMLYINITRTGGPIAAASTGNITNNTVCTIRGGLPLPATQVGMSPIGGSMLTGLQLGSSGVVTLTLLPPNLPFNTGYTFNASATFMRGS